MKPEPGAFENARLAELEGGAERLIALRDQLAAAALTGLLANKGHSLHFHPDNDADYCYRIADAMLKARQPK